MRSRSKIVTIVCASVVPLSLPLGRAIGKDWPHWGGGPARNMVSTDKIPLPADAKIPEPAEGDMLHPPAGTNVKWCVHLGGQTYGNPIVAGGRVYVGTNNEFPRDPKHPGDRGVLMCIEEATGK